MSNPLLKGALILTVATLISKALNLFFRIPLQNIAGDEVFGIFNIVYPFYMVALILSVAGIPIAISKIISEEKEKERPEEVGNLFKTAKILGLLFGASSFLFIFLLQTPISNWLGGSYTKDSLVIVSLTLLLAPYMAVYRGFFQGFGWMTPTALSQVYEQIVRIVLLLLVAAFFVHQGAPNEKVAGYMMISSLMSVIVAYLYLRRKFRTFDYKWSNESYSWLTFKRLSRKILSVSIPIAFGSVMMALYNLVDSLTIPSFLTELGEKSASVQRLYGIYGRGLALQQMATVFSSSIILPLIPMIAKGIAKKRTEETKTIITDAFMYTSVTSWPIAVIGAFLVAPINLALFTDTSENAILALSCVTSIWISYTILGIGVLQGLNAFRLAAVLTFLGIGLKVVFNRLFVLHYGLIGAAIANVVTYFILYLFMIIVIKRRWHIQLWKKESLLVPLLSIGLGFLTYLPMRFVSVLSWGRIGAFFYVCVAFGLASIVYGYLAVKCGWIDQKQLHKLPLIGKISQRLFK